MNLRINIFKWLGLLLLFVFITACSGSNNKQPTQRDIDKLLKQAFNTIKTRDWQNYQALTITSADFILKRRGISKFKEKQSFVGSSLKPSEIDRQRQQFKLAKNAADEFNEDMIYFDKDTYVSLGTLVEQGALPTLDDVRIPFQTYTIKVESESGKAMDDLYPYFVVVQWRNKPRILMLLFPEMKKSR